MERPLRQRLAHCAAVVLFVWPSLAFAGGWDDFVAGMRADGTLLMLKRLAIGLGILFVGWIVARVLASATFALLKRTTVDDKLASMLGINLLLEGKDKMQTDVVERLGSRVVFFLTMLMAIVAALDFAGLTGAAGPISGFVDTIVQALPLIGKAALILVVAYFAGMILRKATTLVLGRVGLDKRLAEASGEKAPFSETAGTVVFWLVMLVGLAGAFEALKIEAVAKPLSNVLDRVVLLLPALAVAALILAGGWILGRIARAVVQNLLHSVGLDDLPTRVKLEGLFQKRAASDVAGLLAMVFIMLHAGIAALDRLGLESLSAPVSSTIEQFWNLLPALVVAALIIAVGVIVGRVVRALVINLLQGVGFDGWLAKMGLDLKRLRRAEGEAEASTSPARLLDTPSEILGTVAQLAVVLAATVEALTTLGLHVWSAMVAAFLSYTLLKVLVALVIVGVGFAVGNVVRDLVAERGEADDAGRAWMGSAARMTVLVFAFTMAIQQLDVAPTFVLLTFCLVFGALCLAVALAFGMGGREVAGDIVKKQYGKAAAKPKSPLGKP